MLERWLDRLLDEYSESVLSFDAVAALRARGIEARRLEDGYPEWKAAGLPVETAPGKI